MAAGVMKSVERKTTQRRVEFKATWPNGDVQKTDVVGMQIAAGYHPGGYGGPNDFKVIGPDDGGSVKIGWWCHDSAD